MKANELMIGDWVRFIPPLGEPRFIKIWEVIGGKDLPWYEPIPLTEDILKANGFKDAMFGYGRHCLRIEGSVADSKITKYYSIEYHPKGCYPPSPDLEQFIEIMLNIGSLRLNCYYVHQLQHALRDCGLNDLAGNFKLKSK